MEWLDKVFAETAKRLSKNFNGFTKFLNEINDESIEYGKWYEMRVTFYRVDEDRTIINDMMLREKTLTDPKDNEKDGVICEGMCCVPETCRLENL